jgi:hypothetical protein
MDELVRMVSQKVGIPEAQARQAVEVVLRQLKQHLPDPIGSQLDGLISGNKSLNDLSSLGDMLKGGDLGGLFGGKK